MENSEAEQRFGRGFRFGICIMVHGNHVYSKGGHIWKGTEKEKDGQKSEIEVTQRRMLYLFRHFDHDANHQVLFSLFHPIDICL